MPGTRLMQDDRIMWHCIGRSSHKMIEPFIDHAVGEGKVSYGLSSYGYDIRLAKRFKVFTPMYGAQGVVDPKNFDERLVTEHIGDHCIIPPNSFVLGVSLERFSMPVNVTGICLGKSTYARCGIIVNITPLEAGWKGYLTIEISNSTPLPVKVYANEGIAQVLFFESEYRPKVTYANRKGKYMDQTQEPTSPKVLPSHIPSQDGEGAIPYVLQGGDSRRKAHLGDVMNKLGFGDYGMVGGRILNGDVEVDGRTIYDRLFVLEKGYTYYLKDKISGKGMQIRIVAKRDRIDEVDKEEANEASEEKRMKDKEKTTEEALADDKIDSFRLTNPKKEEVDDLSLTRIVKCENCSTVLTMMQRRISLVDHLQLCDRCARQALFHDLNPTETY